MIRKSDISHILPILANSKVLLLVVFSIQAEASVRQSASWFSIEDLAGDQERANMTLAAGQKYDSLLRDLTNVSLYVHPNTNETRLV